MWLRTLTLKDTTIGLKGENPVVERKRKKIALISLENYK